MQWISLLILSALITFSPNADAKLFRNTYVSFELPEKWNCKLEATEWVCHSQYSKRSKEAIIILTAKEVGPTDTLQQYMDHLKLPRPLPPNPSKLKMSKLIHVKQRKIAGHTWVDGMHLGSEVPSYYSRYLGTIKNNIAIMVTFSAHQQHYTKYSKDFLSAIQSLRVVAGKNMLGDKKGLGLTGRGQGPVGAPIDGLGISMGESGEMVEEDSSGNKKLLTNMLAIFFIIASIGLYLYAKSGKKGKKKVRRK